MNSLLNMRINLNHALIQIREIVNQHFGIKRHGHKERAHAALDRHQEDISDLETDEESKGHDDGGEGAAGVVGWRGEGEVEVGEEGGHVGDEDGAHG